jgi:hypothetical protein
MLSNSPILGSFRFLNGVSTYEHTAHKREIKTRNIIRKPRTKKLLGDATEIILKCILDKQDIDARSGLMCL